MVIRPRCGGDGSDRRLLAELSTRYPVSAGEAAYVRAAFRSPGISTAVGLLTVAIGVISSAAVTLGSAGYIQQFVGLPKSIIVIAVLVILWRRGMLGILESVILASIFTLIEVGGLVIVVVAAVYADLPVVATTAHMPPLNASGYRESPSLACSHFLLS